MKTRDIRETISRRGNDGVIFVLESLNEQILQTRRDLNELATYFNKMVDSMDGMLAVAERMKQTIEEPEADGLGSSTQSIGTEQ